ncbi:MAG: adenosylcobinamide-GDP ribazoletransferase [Nitrospirales bacterium]|nr:adenosylcobinamide-GDP ribazoletransferase [Nitrospirales bacterium]
MTQVWVAFSVAWQFLTIVPLPGRGVDQPTALTLASSLYWFPVVGVVLGMGLVGLDRLLYSFMDEGARNMILLALLILVTGGLHQDGVADTVDALAGGRDAEHRLKILRDSHIGAIGATGLMISLGLRYAGLMALPAEVREAALVSMPALGRWAMVVGTWRMTSPRSDGLAASFLREMTGRHLLIATLMVMSVLIGLLGVAIAIAVVTGGFVLVRLLNGGFSKLFGGITGDLLGTVNECVEIVFLLLAPLMVSAD